MIDDVTPWPPLIHKVHFKGELDPAIRRIRKNALLIDPNRGVMKGGGKTSAGDDDMPHLWPEFDEFMNWLKPSVEKLWTDVYKLTPADLNVFKSWTNITKSSGYVEEHDHGGCHFAVSMYLEKPEGSGDIQFRNMNLPLNANTPKDGKANGINDYFTEVKAVTGDALIFPGWLPHRVPANPTDKERIVFSFNVHGVSPGSPIIIGDKG